jgi:Tfp pilus assembly protein FimT
MRIPLTFVKEKRRSFSVGELLLVLAMVSVIAGFAVVSLVRANRSAGRTNSAVGFAKPSAKSPNCRIQQYSREFMVRI